MLEQDAARWRELNRRMDEAIRDPDRVAVSKAEIREWEALREKRQIYREAREQAERAAHDRRRGVDRLRHALARQDG